MENYSCTGIIGYNASAVKTKKGFAINFDVAINKSYLSQKTKEFVNVVKWVHCTLWTKSDHAAKSIQKGMFILIEGEPTSKHYIDTNGEIKDTFCVNVRKFELFEKKNTEVNEQLDQVEDFEENDEEGQNYPTPEED